MKHVQRRTPARKGRGKPYSPDPAKLADRERRLLEEQVRAVISASRGTKGRFRNLMEEGLKACIEPPAAACVYTGATIRAAIWTASIRYILVS